MAKKPNDMAKDTTNKKALVNAAVLLGTIMSPFITLTTLTVKAIESSAKKKK